MIHLTVLGRIEELKVSSTRQEVDYKSRVEVKTYIDYYDLTSFEGPGLIVRERFDTRL